MHTLDIFWSLRQQSEVEGIYSIYLWFIYIYEKLILRYWMLSGFVKTFNVEHLTRKWWDGLVHLRIFVLYVMEHCLIQSIYFSRDSNSMINLSHNLIIREIEGFATHICVTRKMRAVFHDAYMRHQAKISWLDMFVTILSVCLIWNITPNSIGKHRVWLLSKLIKAYANSHNWRIAFIHNFPCNWNAKVILITSCASSEKKVKNDDISISMRYCMSW